MREVKRDPWCRHRTAFDQKKFPVCKAGVNYHEFAAQSTDPHYRGPVYRDDMPCLGETPEAKARCPQFSGWTKEENEARELAAAESWNRIKIAFKAIKDATEGKRGIAGQIPCPTCSKPLHYSVARVNGHIHARCETPNCVSFMQ